MMVGLRAGRRENIKKRFWFEKEGGKWRQKKNVREKLFLFVIGWGIDNWIIWDGQEAEVSNVQQGMV